MCEFLFCGWCAVHLEAAWKPRWPFVNREAAVARLAMIVIVNWLGEGVLQDGRSLLSIFGQLFGAGKTMLGKNFLAKLRAMYAANDERLAELRADPARHALLKRLVSDDAITVVLDLSELSSRRRTLEAALAALVAERLATQGIVANASRGLKALFRSPALKRKASARSPCRPP